MTETNSKETLNEAKVRRTEIGEIVRSSLLKVLLKQEKCTDVSQRAYGFISHFHLYLKYFPSHLALKVAIDSGFYLPCPDFYLLIIFFNILDRIDACDIYL